MTLIRLDGTHIHLGDNMESTFWLTVAIVGIFLISIGDKNEKD